MRYWVVSLLAAVSAFLPALSPASLLATAGISSVQPDAPVAPVTATITRTTYSIGRTGAITLRLEERGTFARNDKGDEATRLKVLRDGRTLPGSSVISQRLQGIRYLMDDARQKYQVVPWPARGMGIEADRQATPPVTRMIGGLKCVAVPVWDSAGKTVGKDWVSPEYGIKVRSEIDIRDSQTGVVTGLVVEELSDIRVGEEPDPTAFLLPAGYQRVESRGAR